MAANKIKTYKQESFDDSRQTSPAWMVTFVRFSQRGPASKNPMPGIAGLDTRKPLVVINDCFSVSTNQTKSGFSHSFDASFLSGDINYSTAISPGDYAIINIVDDEGKIPDLYSRALASKPINRYEDGFKGLYKVQSVHQSLVQGPDGKKRLIYKITGYSHNELNNVIYFNPYLIHEYQNSPLWFWKAIADSWNLKIKDGEYASVHNLIVALYEAFVGKSINKLKAGNATNQQQSENRPYQVPGEVMNLMGIPTTSSGHITDLNNFVIGVQSFREVRDEWDAQKPYISSSNGRTFSTGSRIQGHSFAKPEYFNQVKVWDLLQQYLVGPINEMYTAFKPGMNPGESSIFPTLIVREKPFTTNLFAKKMGTKVTTFLSLPRWILDYENITALNVGRDDAARFNYVQVFGMNQGNNKDVSIWAQINSGNYDIDRDDIKKMGLRPFVATIPYDWNGAGPIGQTSKAPYWAKLIGDWIIGGHLKMSGSVQCWGVEKPISIGDNVQIGDTVYHIETINHTASVGADGKRVFRTSMQISNGIDDNERADAVPYSEMEHTAADSMREDHYNSYGDILPGVSDSQDLPGAPSRKEGERIDGKDGETKQSPFNSPIKRKRGR